MANTAYILTATRGDSVERRLVILDRDDAVEARRRTERRYYSREGLKVANTYGTSATNYMSVMRDADRTVEVRVELTPATVYQGRF